MQKQTADKPERGRVSLMREFVDLVNERVHDRFREVGHQQARRELRAHDTTLAQNAAIARRYASILCDVREKMIEDLRRPCRS